MLGVKYCMHDVQCQTFRITKENKNSIQSRFSLICPSLFTYYLFTLHLIQLITSIDRFKIFVKILGSTLLIPIPEHGPEIPRLGGLKIQ